MFFKGLNMNKLIFFISIITATNMVAMNVQNPDPLEQQKGELIQKFNALKEQSKPGTPQEKLIKIHEEARNLRNEAADWNPKMVKQLDSFIRNIGHRVINYN